MGRDIYLYAEKKQQDEWVCVNRLIQNEPFGGPALQHHADYICKPFDVGRRRIMHDMLGGFQEQEDIAFIKDYEGHRGLPSDISASLMQTYRHDENDVFGASWLYWDEILNFEWDGKFTDVEVGIDKTNLDYYREGLFPSNPYGKMSKLEVLKTSPSWNDKYVDVKLRESYWGAGGFELIKKYVSPHLGSEPNSLRLVFWFSC